MLPAMQACREDGINALHNTRFVEPQTRRRIEEAIVALNYTPNIRARQLRTGKTNTIALLSSVPLAIASGASRLGFMMEVALTSAMMALEKQHALILVPPGQIHWMPSALTRRS